MMIIYAFVFGVGFGAREDYFGLFIFIGLTMWQFFNSVIKHSVKIIKSNKAILSKVYIPKYVLILSDMLENGFKMAVSFCIVIIMLFFFKVPVGWSVLWLLPVLPVLFLITFSFSLILTHLGVFIQDMPNVIDILLRLMFYLTGIFYDIQKRLPAPFNFWILRINPMACIIVQTRGALLQKQVMMPELLLIWLIIGLVVAIFGIRLIYRNENGYIKVI